MNTLSLSARAELLKPSPTLSISAKANQMKADGIDVVPLSAGEPDFSTPESISRAAIEAIERGFTKYTASTGTKELKEAIIGKLERENGLTYKPEQIVVSCGAKHSLYNTLQVLISPGDEVILLAPYWMTYADQVMLAGGVPVEIQCTQENDFAPTEQQLKEAITSKTKAIMINAPSNPTGAVLPRQCLKEVAALALRHGLWIIADEIYERLVYDGYKQDSIAGLGRDVYDQTITIGGVSKTYAMTGWRIGFSAAPATVAKAIGNLQDQITSNPTSFAQVGAAAAFNMPSDAVETMRKEFEERRNLVVSLLENIDGVKVRRPGGAFYVFPDVSAFLGPDLPTDIELAAYLLEEAHVATVPGSVFKGAGHIRMSYAASRQDIERGVARIAEVLNKRR